MVTNIEDFGDSLVRRQIEIQRDEKNTTNSETSSYAVFINLENIGNKYTI
jgi:hypothetical protein